MTFRLTLWYTGLFGALSLGVFLLVYVSLTSHLHAQADNELLDTAREFEALYRSHGEEALTSEFRREAQSRGVSRVFFRLLSAKGDVLAASDLEAWSGLEPPGSGSAGPTTGQPTFRTLSLPGHRHKVRVVIEPAGGDRAIEVGMTLRDAEIMMERYRETFGTALALMLACGGLVGWLLARKAMSGVQRVTTTAAGIGKGDLARRVPLGGEGREIDDLARAFNDMLGRIEALVKELKEVTDNVAHDLRSPITRIRGIAETTLTGRGDAGDFREMAATVIEESDRLIEMINTMLEITKADSGVAELAGDQLDLREIVREAVDLFHPLAEDKCIGMTVNLPEQPVLVLGDRAKLQRAVANLLDNAIKYTPSGGTVTASIGADAERARIDIADTGIGIDEKNIPRIFDRFYRCDESRSSSGSGLGLSLAQAIIRAHGGGISVKSGIDEGSVFSVSLPLHYPPH